MKESSAHLKKREKASEVREFLTVFYRLSFFALRVGNIRPLFEPYLIRINTSRNNDEISDFAVFCLTSRH